MYRPKTMYELQLLKSKLSSEVKLKEELVIYETFKMKDSFADKVKLFASFYSKKLAFKLVTRLLKTKRTNRK